MTPTSPPTTRGRRSTRQADETRASILQAALEVFSAAGYGAGSLREIGRLAGVSQQLITHHFETKLSLWKSVVDAIFGQLGTELADRARGLEGVSVPERMRLMMRQSLMFSAEHPQLARLMNHEGANPGERLTWLVERHVRPLFATLQAEIEEAQALGLAPAGEPVHIAYVLHGASMLFAHAAEFEMLTGRSASAPEVVDAHLELVLGMLLPGAGAQAPTPEKKR